jgi:hypothetical protein
MLTIILVPNRFAGLLYPTALSAWGYQRHKVVVSVADKLLNAKPTGLSWRTQTARQGVARDWPNF